MTRTTRTRRAFAIASKRQRCQAALLGTRPQASRQLAPRARRLNTRTAKTHASTKNATPATIATVVHSASELTTNTTIASDNVASSHEIT